MHLVESFSQYFFLRWRRCVTTRLSASETGRYHYVDFMILWCESFPFVCLESKPDQDPHKHGWRGNTVVWARQAREYLRAAKETQRVAWIRSLAPHARVVVGFNITVDNPDPSIAGTYCCIPRWRVRCPFGISWDSIRCYRMHVML